MPMKIYVLVVHEQNEDGDLIQTVFTYFNRPETFTYVDWV